MPPEPRPKPTFLAYAGLGAVWLLVVGWLALEHAQGIRLARNAVLNRARDISNTIALVCRAGPPGFIPQSRLERVLNELVQSTELRSVVLLNAEGDVVTTAGAPIHIVASHLPPQGAQWNAKTVTIVNLVDFGQSTRSDGTFRSTTVVIPRSEERNRQRERERREFFRRAADHPTTETRSGEENRPPFSRRRDEAGPPPPPPPGSEPGPPPPPHEIQPGRAGLETASGQPVGDTRSDRERADHDARPDGRRFPSRRVFHRPWWMDRTRYEELLAKRGLHGFVLVMSTDKMRSDLEGDLWLRMTIAGAALAAVVGFGFAWRGLVKSTQLRIRLVRAQEMNEHLREMNLAAAGLAHEARNPLNIVRGVAQLINKQEGVPEVVRTQAKQITEEVDQVTQRLNEFIKYSRPMQLHLASTPLATVVGDVVSALQSDLEDKGIQTNTQVPPRNIQADESLLRQVIFNLLINAIQAVKPGGRVTVSFSAEPHSDAVLTVEDDGPGVPPDQREQIFRPYFTTHEEGSGLGLAVVRQIVLSHRWGIECGESPLGGAAFRISGLKVLNGEDKAAGG